MARADYTYNLAEKAGRNVIVIEDLALGSKSVTNDIENILHDIALIEKIDPSGYLVVYKDSNGIWDGYEQPVESYILLDEDNWQDAVYKFLQLTQGVAVGYV